MPVSIRKFRRSDRDQLASRVNLHVAAVIPGGRCPQTLSCLNWSMSRTRPSSIPGSRNAAAWWPLMTTSSWPPRCCTASKTTCPSAGLSVPRPTSGGWWYALTPPTRATNFWTKRSRTCGVGPPRPSTLTAPFGRRGVTGCRASGHTFDSFWSRLGSAARLDAKRCLPPAVLS